MLEVLSAELKDALEEMAPNVGSFTIEPDFWAFWGHTDPNCWYHLIGSVVEELTPLLALFGGSAASSVQARSSAPQRPASVTHGGHGQDVARAAPLA